MPLGAFHPAVRRWFERRFPDGPSAPQARGWPAIRSGRDTLIAAPTGSGKTLAAFLSAIDDLVRLGLDGGLPDETRVLYVSPLKALSNDIEKNLAEPLAGIRAELEASGLPAVEIRTAVRTGDTKPHERRTQLERPPHLFVTTPESLFILLTTRRGRELLQSVRTVIVDEIHALADDKRGSHLALTLARLDRLTSHGAAGDVDRRDGRRVVVEAADLATRPAGRPPTRIGLSATVDPLDAVARFLVGAGDDREPDVEVVDEGHLRTTELAVEIPDSPLEALASNEMWEEVYDRLAELVEAHRTTLVFVNTRRTAERVVHHLSKRIGEDLVASHHGSLSRARRLDAEARLKAGELRAIVATASLELGIDVGAVELVCQLGSPRSITTLLQRVGRSGRRMGDPARGRLFALSRDELVECAALVRTVHEGRLDRLVLPEEPLDILAQQIVAEAGCRDVGTDELYGLVRRAWPFRNLARDRFDAIVRMLADGYATDRGRRGARIRLDEVNGIVRGSRGARWAAVTSGGAIPDTFDYQVVLDPEGVTIGTINEDFAIESIPGDIFQLGNASWRLLKVETGRVRVADAKGQPPTIPFWLGEAPARTVELSEEVGRLRADVEARLEGGVRAAAAWLVDEIGLPAPAARQLAEYLDATRRVLTVVPTRETLVLERFFDEAGGMQLVVHAPFGGRINRAWGLALRKKFCRSFDFELQAAANEDAIVLSLGPQHSFPLVDVFGYLGPADARELLVQALLAAPMFGTRWRWNATRSLAVLRRAGGRPVPPQLLRMRTDDLLVAAFPQAAACFEHIVGDIEVPDHPLVEQTVEDCLVEAMDVDGLEALLARIAAGELRLVARDVPEPSPMAHEILNARPYAFLDDAPAEERRTLAVQTRRSLDVRTADELGTLDPAAIERVRAEAWPEPADAEDVVDALGWLGIVTEGEAAGWRDDLDALARAGRATRLSVAAGDGGRRGFWVAVERLPEARAVWPDLETTPAIEAPERYRRAWGRGEALVALLRGRLEGLGPVTAAGLARPLGLDAGEVAAALEALEGEGVVLRGRFSPPAGGGEPALEWCHRRLLARIHRATLDRLRAEIEPVAPATFMRFLFGWHGLVAADPPDGPTGLLAVLGQLEGFEAPAIAWERDLLPARLPRYEPAWLDELCLSGEIVWCRLVPPPVPTRPDGRAGPRTGPVAQTPLALARREDLGSLLALAPAPAVADDELGPYARAVLASLRDGGAAFAVDLQAETGLLPTDVERGLAELAAWGIVTADGFEALRGLVRPERERRVRRRRRAGRQPRFTAGSLTGRWSLVRRPGPDDRPAEAVDAEGQARYEALVEAFARRLLARYGIVARRLLEREPALAPWRDVLRTLRRLEMRGEVRGGRFVQGFAGEQFALPEAVDALRAIRRREPDGSLVVVNGGDPLNLAGILVPGERVAALPTNRIVYRDGIPVAVREGGVVRLEKDDLEPEARRQAESLATTGLRLEERAVGPVRAR